MTQPSISHVPITEWAALVPELDVGDLIWIPIESFAKTLKFERTRVGKNTGSAYG